MLERGDTQAARVKKGLTVDCAGVDYCGGAGFAMLVALEKAGKESHVPVHIEGLAPKFRAMFDAVDRRKLEQPRTPERGHGHWVADVGSAAAMRAGEWVQETGFVGEVTAGLVSLGRHPRRLRLREWLVIVKRLARTRRPSHS